MYLCNLDIQCLKLLGGGISREANFKDLYYIYIYYWYAYLLLQRINYIIHLYPLSNHVNLSQSLLFPWLGWKCHVFLQWPTLLFSSTHANKTHVRLPIFKAAFLNTTQAQVFVFLSLDVSFHWSILGVTAANHLEIWHLWGADYSITELLRKLKELLSPVTACSGN